MRQWRPPRLAPSAGSAQQVVNLDALNKLEFSIPGSEEQTAIATILSDLHTELAALEVQDCGKPIQGRPDKKFCDDACRNTFNNQQNAVSTNFIRNVNHALKRNRNILSELLPEGEKMAKTTRDKLNLEGFNFRYFTHIFQNQKGNVYHYCYDFGYLALENDWFLIVRGKA